jgi:hypothetical protein
MKQSLTDITADLSLAISDLQYDLQQDLTNQERQEIITKLA